MAEIKILSGKTVSQDVYNALQSSIDTLKSSGCTPGLAAVLVGDDPASNVYVNSKTRRFNKLGLFSESIRLPENISEDELLSKIKELNNDDRFHGILVQMPLPRH
ncbi:MAG TPA: bifunctional 5,10-methylene-tetrahydrofolate dehydrogenase/5,10-methylene-tetrahydrofolate cyclohydrolase, partial [Candidatus Marinimicrobia bacterium]|nr:bifunctional 5,10-methylene-tetrahydrofolate dehydrogenase/5,10-methylene-tetrahydrofolate cyclohydrolase [Candidatus Neomarinimicrobiota bacterium]